MTQTAQTYDTEFSNLLSYTEKYAEHIDWVEVDIRIRDFMVDARVNCSDVVSIFGIAMEDDDYMEKINSLPKLQATIAVSMFLGIPAAWVLTGKGEKPQANKNTINNGSRFHDALKSTVVQGNTAETLIVHSNAEAHFSDLKKELVRIFDRLTIREQTRLLSVAYDIEENARAAQ